MSKAEAKRITTRPTYREGVNGRMQRSAGKYAESKQNDYLHY
jgi:hypothetical protein